jgi:hypothetical protein
MRYFIAFVLLLFCHAMASAKDDAPQGKNCNLSTPPAAAGEEIEHGIVLRIYPRAKDIDSKYTGCQALFVPDNKKWIVVSLVEIINGDPVRVWSPDEENARLACRFKNGKVVQGDPDQCPMPKFLLMSSLPSGCVRIIQESVAKHGLGAPRPSRCEYD